ncbi:MAG: WYL domain-containing protein [Propionibacteriaceae bacterium]|nr:WYL domain-containing protein [Propionibacteriaceae bacterium]
MAARNSERLLNLVIALLATPRYLTYDQIRDRVEGYQAAKTDDAFRRMFERDKEDLRGMGIAVLVGPSAESSGEADGYRIRPDDFYLPAIHLTPAESTLVGLAASVWSEPALAGDVDRAMTKLRTVGEPVSTEGLRFLTPRLAAREPAFPVLWEALLARQAVEFTYHGRPRVVEGWRLILRSGAWYLLGRDRGVGVRMFRVSRIEDRPRRAGEPGAYTLPATDTIDERAKSLEPAPPVATVVVALRESAAGDLRRRGTPAGVATPEGYEAVAVPYALVDEVARAIAAAGPDALVLEPGDVRDRVLAHLRAVAGGGS